MDARVRQLTRTELAWRVKSAQCLRSPQSLTKLLGTPIDGYCLGFMDGEAGYYLPRISRIDTNGFLYYFILTTILTIFAARGLLYTTGLEGAIVMDDEW